MLSGLFYCSAARAYSTARPARKRKTLSAAVRGLLQKAKIPVVCTYQGAGVVPREHFDHFGGRVGLFRTQPADKLLDSADLVITIGYDPIEYEPGLWNKDRTRNIIHIDC